jgi:SAM-dependent methyltransferase
LPVGAGLLYDDIGRGYTVKRREDRRIAEALWDALGDAQSVLNVGAGAGAYEPADRRVLAVEPSSTMIAQRPPGAAPVLRASAEALPLSDDSFDAVMAVLSDHHWGDRLQGLRELRRVARRRVVLFNADPAQAPRFWLSSEYFPEFLELIPERYRESGFWEAELAGELGSIRLHPVPIPRDCRDGFYAAYWRRPEAYLDPRVRAAISGFARSPQANLHRGLDRLRKDLESGAWRSRHADLLGLDELDLGYRVVVAKLDRS